MSEGYYPIFLDLKSRPCVVIGGGDVSGRKAATLLEFGADVTIVAPRLSVVAAKLAEDQKVIWHNKIFEPEDIDGATLVIGATDDESVNREVYDEAKKRSIPVNIVDQPHLCSFIVPALVRRGALTIAVSTSGKSPAVAKRVRKKLESEFGDEWGVYLDMMGKARSAVQKSVEGIKPREVIFNKLADSDLFNLVASGDTAAARQLIEEITGCDFDTND